MLVDLINDILSVDGIAAQAITQATTGAGNDFSDGEVSTAAILSVGAQSAASPNLNVQIEESSSTNTGFTAISGMVFAAVTTLGRQVVRGLRTKQFVRANVTTLTGTSFTMNVEILAQRKYVTGSGNAGGYDRSPST